MDDRGFLALLRRRWLVVVVFGLLGLLAALGYLLAVPPVYTARADLFVATVGASSSSDLAQGSDYSQEAARNYAALATLEAVLDPVIAELELDTTRTELASRVQASVELNTSLMSVTVEDQSAEGAATIANAVSASLIDVVGTLVPRQDDGTLPVRVQVVQQATAPEQPSSPNTAIALVAGAVGGAVVGAALLLVSELAGGKVRSPQQVRDEFDLPLLGEITDDHSADKFPVLPESGNRTRRAEEYRSLRTNLRFLNLGSESKYYTFTSTMAGEGKSTTAVNVAVALAAAGDRVCLVEADLRRPRVSSLLDLEGSIGLTTVVAGAVALEDALQPWGEHGLHVLASGRLPPDPSELLGSRAAEQLFAQLGGQFDSVVVDCPPLGAVTDAAVLAGYLGGVIMVVACDSARVREVRRSITGLQDVGVPVLGAVTTFVPDSGRARYTKSYLADDPSAA